MKLYNTKYYEDIIYIIIMLKKLKTAIKKGHEKAVAELIEKAVADLIDKYKDLNTKELNTKELNTKELNTKYLNPAVIYAVENGYVKMVPILLEKGANVNLQMDDDATLLYIATEQGRKDMVEILLKNGANVDTPAKVWNGHMYVKRSPLSIAVIKLIEGWVPSHSSSHDRDTIKLLVNHGADIHKKDETGPSPLDIAEGKPEIKTFLIEVDKQYKILLMNEIYGKQGLGLGDDGMDVTSRIDLYTFLGGKKRKSTKKRKNTKKRKSTTQDKNVI